jgi:hypothetical protein
MGRMETQEPLEPLDLREILALKVFKEPQELKDLRVQLGHAVLMA